MKRKKMTIYLIILVIIVFNESNINPIQTSDSIHPVDNQIQVVNGTKSSSHEVIERSYNKTNTRQLTLKTTRIQNVTTAKSFGTETGFISVWDTNEFGAIDSSQIKLPLESNGIYDFNVLWGDGTNSTITAYNQPEVTHTYKIQGQYMVNITGTIIGWRFNGTGDVLKLIQISNWGPLRLGNAGYYFSGAQYLAINASDTPDLKGTTNLQGMFYNCPSLWGYFNNWNVSQVTDMSYMFFNDNLNNAFVISNWNVSKVTDMSFMFNGATNFNQPIGNWNVSQVTDMSSMFRGDAYFNQPIGSWNVSQVTDMSSMFSGATNFDQPINNWKVSQVTDMSSMFSGATNFDQPIGNWKVSQVTDMSSMFNGATNFNQPIGNWNVSQVTDMSSMFSGATNFDKPIGNWNVSQVTDMSSMFYDDQNFNQPLNNWNVAKVTNMYEMFSDDYNFNQTISNWDVSQVTLMIKMFAFASSFNQPIDNWNVSQVVDMDLMFASSSFNQPINNWDVSKVNYMSYMFQDDQNFNQPINNWNVSQVTDMSFMFYNDRNFNQPIGTWNVSKVVNMRGILDNCSLSTANYNQLLQGWSSLPYLQYNVSFDVGSTQYSSYAKNAREKLIKTYGWIITDGGLIPTSELNIFKSLVITGLMICAGAFIVGISGYILIIYILFKKNNKKGQKRGLSFWTVLMTTFKFKKQQQIRKESLRTETLDKIEIIIKENKTN